MQQVSADEHTEAALQGLARAASALAAGEICHAECIVPERDGTNAESAVRALLGAAGEGLDVLVAVRAVHDIVEHQFRLAVAGELDVAAAEREANALRESGAARVVACTVVVARTSEPRAPITLRVHAGVAATAHDLEPVLAHAASPRVVTPNLLDELRPHLSPHARLQITHAPGEDGWAPLGCVIILDHPVRRTLQAGTNLAGLVGSCDGQQTARALFEQFAVDADPRDDLTEAKFAEVLQQLIADGYLVLDPPHG